MINNSTPADSSLSRYELKYFVPHEQVAEICQFIAPYCQLDSHSATAPNHFYPVYNIYLDTPDSYFLRQRLANAANRFNMRIRIYQATPTNTHLYLELKHRIKEWVYKTRFMLPARHLAAFTSHQLLAKDLPLSKTQRNHAVDFQNKLTAFNAGPKIFTRYERKAFFSRVDFYARVTFDRSLAYYPENTYDTTPKDEYFTPYDHQGIFQPGCSVVLELKCIPDQVPAWMIDLIRRFELKRMGFSKFMHASLAMAQTNRIDHQFYHPSIDSIFSREH